MRLCAIAAVSTAVFASPSFGENAKLVWSVSEGTDAFTDVSAFTLEISSDDGNGVVFSCEGRALIEVGIFWLGAVAGHPTEKSASVNWRVGKLKAHSAEWNIHDLRGSDALLLSSETDAAPLAADLLSQDDSDAVVRFRTNGGFAEFPVAGFAEGWSALATKCAALGER